MRALMSSALLFAIVGLSAVMSASARAQSTAPAATRPAPAAPQSAPAATQSAPAVRRESASAPVGRENPAWLARHEALVARARQGGVEVAFLGDSITQGWEGAGRDVWDRYYGQRRAANFGISGDRTQHVLWRLDHGLLDALAGAAVNVPASAPAAAAPGAPASAPTGSPARVAASARAAAPPKLIILMIGTNNSNGDDHTAAEIADGIRAIVTKLRGRLPETKVLLLGIFPRGEQPDAQRAKNAEASRLAAALADGRMVQYLNIGPKFLDADGTLSRDIMPDLLHLSPRGYEIWAEAIEAKVREMLGE